MENYLVFLTGDGDVSLTCYAKDEMEAEEFGYKWAREHNYKGYLTFIEELTPPDEVEL